jgi:hypothetical protein
MKNLKSIISAFLGIAFLIFGISLLNNDFYTFVFGEQTQDFISYLYKSIFGFGGISLGLIGTIDGIEGASALGSNTLGLGPANIYFGNFSATTLTGTVDTTSGDATVTGTGTAFDTELAVGDIINIVGITGNLQVASIASATSLELTANASATVAGAAATQINAVNLGGVDGVTLKYGVKKTELKESQKGDNPADKAVTGYTCEIECSMTRPTLVRLEKVLQGFLLNRNITTAAIEGAAFTLPIGETDLEIAGQLKIVRISKGAESTDPLDVITVPLCAPNTEAETKYDATTQRMVKSMFTGYADENTLYNGKPVIFYLGSIA